MVDVNSLQSFVTYELFLQLSLQLLLPSHGSLKTHNHRTTPYYCPELFSDAVNRYCILELLHILEEDVAVEPGNVMGIIALKKDMLCILKRWCFVLYEVGIVNIIDNRIR